MKSAIQKFIDDKKLAIVGASNNKDNFGTFLMKELQKLGYEVYPVNPGCEEIEGISCVPTVKELPPEIENAILAVPSELWRKAYAVPASVLDASMCRTRLPVASGGVTRVQTRPARRVIGKVRPPCGPWNESTMMVSVGPYRKITNKVKKAARA